MKNKLKEILTLYKNDLWDTARNQAVNDTTAETIKHLLVRLGRFGEDKGIEACERYLWSAPSNFFDHSYLMRCLLDVVDIPDANDEWTRVLQVIRLGGSLNKLTQKTVDSLGGLDQLAKSENIGLERHNFIKTYTELKQQGLVDYALNGK